MAVGVSIRFAVAAANEYSMTAGSLELSLEEIRDAFQLLANETRIEILLALWTRPTWEATFTELKNAVGMRDSGQFQYHLNKLAGTFIQ